MNFPRFFSQWCSRAARRLVTAALFVLPLAEAEAVQFTVTTAADAGPGSLRAALTAANATPAADNIVFASSFTIELLTELPVITSPVNILGDAHLGAGASPGVKLDGHLIPVRSSIVRRRLVYEQDAALHLEPGAGGSTIRGLRFWKWSAHPERTALRVEATDCGIFNCHFQYDPAQGADLAYLNLSVIGTGPGLRVGASGTGMGNVFANGIFVGAGGRVEGNLFGFSPITGEPFPDTLGRVDYWISGDGGNLLQVGGTTADRRNYFATCSQVCVRAYGAIIVEGNWFGFNPAGTAHPVGMAVSIATQALVHIGGMAEGAGNVIAATGDPGTSGRAIWFNSWQRPAGGGAGPHLVARNTIGLHPDGRPLGGPSGGILFNGREHVTCVDNRVYGTIMPGIQVSGKTADPYDPAFDASAELIRNFVTMNSTGAPIVISATPEITANTLNDSLDADTGSNGLQNTPVLSSLSRQPDGSVVVGGLLSTHPSESFRLEFFSGAVPFSGPQTFLTSAIVTTGAGGDAAISVNAGNIPGNVSISATATRLASVPGPQTGPFSNVLTLPSSGRFQFAAGTVTGPEGSTRTVEIQRINSSAGPASVRITADAGGPVAGQDFSLSGTDAPDGTVNFAHGQLSRTITLNILQDDIDEADSETLILQLQNPSGGASASGVPKLIGLLDDDAGPSVSINSVSVTEGNSGVALMNFTATLSRSSERVIALLPGSPTGTGATPADAGDFGTPTVMLLTPGSYLITIPVLGDTFAELNETFLQGATLRLSTASPGVFEDIIASPGTGTILNDDAAAPQSFSFTTSNAQPAESAGTFTATITRTSGLGAVSVEVVAVDGTATRGVDYLVDETTTLNFPDGVTSQTVDVTMVDDALHEDRSRFVLRLTNPSPGTGISPQPVLTVTIKDNDDAPKLYLSGAALPEGNPGGPAAMASCLFTLSEASEVPVTVFFATRDGTADSSDYTPVSGSISFAPGTTTQTVEVPILADRDFEAAEQFYLDVLTGTGFSSYDTTLTVTVGNDDPAWPVLSFGAVPKEVLEIGGPQTLAIKRTGQIDIACQFSLVKTGGTAKTGDDFTALPATFVIPAGVREILIPFTPVNDSQYEATKDLLLQIQPTDSYSQTGTPDTAKFDLINDDLQQIRFIKATQPDPVEASTGDLREFPETVVGGSGDLIFTLQNTGNTACAVAIYLTGPGTAAFSLVSPPANLPAFSGPVPFSVRFTPANEVEKSAVLHVEGVFANHLVIDLFGTGVILSATTDSDGDGLNDLAEYEMRGLGFDRKVAQPALVAALFGGSNTAGLFTQAQIQALKPETPLLAKDPVTGEFRITLGLMKSSDLTLFTPFPMAPAGTSVNPSGRVEYRFTLPDSAAFFRVEAGK